MTLTRHALVSVLLVCCRTRFARASACAGGQWNPAMNQPCNQCPDNSYSNVNSTYITECSCTSGADIAEKVTTTISCSGSCSCPHSNVTTHGVISDGEGDYSSLEQCYWMIHSNALISIQFTEFNTHVWDAVSVLGCTTATCLTFQEYARISGTGQGHTGHSVFTNDQIYKTLSIGFVSNLETSGKGFVAKWWTSGDSYNCPAVAPPPPTPPTPPTPTPPPPPPTPTTPPPADATWCPAGSYHTLVYTDGWLGQVYDHSDAMETSAYTGFDALSAYITMHSRTIDYATKLTWPWPVQPGGSLFHNMPFSWAARWRGFIYIAAAGEYTFHMRSDDGSWLWINEILVLANDHSANKMVQVSANIVLTAGYHSARVHYYNGFGEGGIVVHSSGPGTDPWTLLPGYTINGHVCLACPPGSYRAGFGPGLCLVCPPDAFANTESSSECTVCPSGKIVAIAGNVSFCQFPSTLPPTTTTTSPAPRSTTNAPRSTTNAPRSTTNAPRSTTNAPRLTTTAPRSTTTAPRSTTTATTMTTTSAAHEITVLPTTTPMPTLQPSITNDTMLRPNFVYIFIFRLPITVAVFESQRIIFILALATVYEVPTDNILVRLVTAEVISATGTTSRRLAAFASPAAHITVTVSISFPTPASGRTAVDLGTINRELGRLQLFSVSSVTSVSADAGQREVVAGKRRIWGVPVLFFWGGWGLLCFVLIVLMCGTMFLCCCGTYSAEQRPQPYGPMRPLEANPHFEDHQMHFVQPISHAPVPIYYV